MVQINPISCSGIGSDRIKVRILCRARLYRVPHRRRSDEIFWWTYTHVRSSSCQIEVSEHPVPLRNHSISTNPPCPDTSKRCTHRCVKPATRRQPQMDTADARAPGRRPPAWRRAPCTPGQSVQGWAAAADGEAAGRRTGPAPRAGSERTAEARRRARAGGGVCCVQTPRRLDAHVVGGNPGPLEHAFSQLPAWSRTGAAPRRPRSSPAGGSTCLWRVRASWSALATTSVASRPPSSNPSSGSLRRATRPLTILAPDRARCTTPEWNLPATETVLKVLKAGGTLRKQGPQHTFRFLLALAGCEPSSGKASGAEPVTLTGHGFCPPSLCPGATYTSAFSGRGGRQAVSEPCTVDAHLEGHRLVCPTPRWAFPAEATTISVLKDGELLAGECETVLECFAAGRV